MTAKQLATIVNKVPILSIDLGRTSTKACISRYPDGVVLIPANVAHLTVEQVRRGGFEARLGDPLLDIWLEYQGKGYAIGQLAADFGANLGVGQSKVEDALIKVFACVGHFELQGDLAIIMGLPYHSQEQFEREKEELIGILASPHVMYYRGEQVSITIKKVWVIPEGYGSLIWVEVQEKEPSDGGLHDRSVAVVDIGHQTTDFIMADSFRFARGASQSEAFAMNEFYDQLAAQIQGADSQSLLLIKAVNRPEGERFYRPKGAAQPTDLDEIIPSLRKSFARELSDRLLAWLPERTTDVVVTGGGGQFFWNDLQLIFKEARLKGYLAQPSRKANALGQYIYGEVQKQSASR
ncbi:chromosome segregation protein ParM [Moorena producens PAL-8-15-08-1]|uniref:Chromosome segregation protein ParM n=1 Tax=Moorena producens PAL-8-15-08-1 TaxID=1458985 RepID=A0A1D8TUB4_9CYAN|nr:ParM/StbA family protein [Moorena producens]AOX01231.1 chromosome segregation protein ParM [Moorena producens PAL-8-15-08-1]